MNYTIPGSGIIKIDADTNKFAENEEDLGKVISSIDSTLFGLF